MAFSQEFSLTFLTSAKPRSAALLCAQCDGNSLAVGMGKGPAEVKVVMTWSLKKSYPTRKTCSGAQEVIIWMSRVFDLEANDSSRY